MKKTWRDYLHADETRSRRTADLDRHVAFIVADLERRDLLRTAEFVAKHFGTSLSSILGPTHEHPQAYARAILWAIVRRERNMSYPQLGRLFRRDHTTVCSRIGDLLIGDIRAVERALASGQLDERASLSMRT